MGRRAVVVDDPPGGPAAWGRGLVEMGIAGVVDVVPAARTVLVHCASAADLAEATERFGEVTIDLDRPHDAGHVVIPVTYDGDDLATVARTTGLTIDQVIARHSGATYVVAFCGFAPGFGYLTGLPDELHVARRATPRDRVPAGSVAIAAEYSAVYPRSSPGGWHLLGSTTAILFDVERDPPALLRPGAVVRFERS